MVMVRPQKRSECYVRKLNPNNPLIVIEIITCLPETFHIRIKIKTWRNASRISGRTDVAYVVLSHWTYASPGLTNFYVNDYWTSTDGDGLGAALTLPVPSCPPLFAPQQCT